MTKPDTPVLKAKDYGIRDIGQAEALALVKQYHYAKGGSNTGVYRHGLYHRDNPDEILGVAWWIPPTKAAALSVHEEWRRVLTLTRLVVKPEVPQNAASFLIARSIKEIKKDRKWVALVTYADEGQEHTGAIYRATNWEYVGTMKGHPVWRKPDGSHVSTKRAGKNRTYAEMEALGYVKSPPTRKHKFTMMLDAPLAPPEKGR